MSRNTSKPPGAPVGADEALNDKFHQMLREAAERRADRALAQSSGDAIAARQELAGILALARSHSGERPPRGRPGRPA